MLDSMIDDIYEVEENKTASVAELNVKKGGDDLIDSEFWKIRDEAIPLPGGADAEDGYSRVLLVGVTGAGKTTIVRQLLGTDIKNEKFPATNASRTTTCNLEIIVAEGDYRGVVTFISRKTVYNYIKECVLAAAKTMLENYWNNDKKNYLRIAEILLEHTEQKFRLKYILGDADFLKKTKKKSEIINKIIDKIDREERERRKKLIKYIKRIMYVAAKVMEQLIDEMKMEKHIEASNAQAEWMHEQFEKYVLAHFDFNDIVNDIFEDCRSMFDLLDVGTIEFDDGWPCDWLYECSERSQFMKLLNRFTTNEKKYYGQNLTPMVEGIRIRGEFFPKWYQGKTLPKIVIMDGQGLGHEARINTAVSTNITNKFYLADKIVLVDSAVQPMQGPVCSAMHSLITSGNADKMLLAFTHGDRLEGDNFSDFDDVENHIKPAIRNGIHAIGEDLGKNVERELHKIFYNDNVFIFGWMHKNLLEIKKDEVEKSGKQYDDVLVVRDQLNKFIDCLIAPVDQKKTRINIQGSYDVLCIPIYNIDDFHKGVYAAVDEFHEMWLDRLGIKLSYSEEEKTYWNTVKAFTRRMAYFDNEDEFRHLKPVAELVRLLQNNFSKNIDRNVVWKRGSGQNEEMRKAVLDAIKREVYKELHKFLRKKIKYDIIDEWKIAYEYSGTGSTRERANKIMEIFEKICSTKNRDTDFYHELFEIFADAIVNNGGECLHGEPVSAEEKPDAETIEEEMHS